MYDYFRVLQCLAFIAVILAGFSYLFATAFTLGTVGG